MGIREVGQGGVYQERTIGISRNLHEVGQGGVGIRQGSPGGETR